MKVKAENLLPKTAQSIMGAEPTIINNNFISSNYVGAAPGDDMDSFSSRVNNGVMSRFLNDASDSWQQTVDKSLRNGEGELFRLKQEMESNGELERFNSVGEFFQNQLTQVVPFLLYTQQRGMTFYTMPTMVYNTGGKTFKVQAYDWSAKWSAIEENPSTDIERVTVEPKETEHSIATYALDVVLNNQEQLAVMEALKANGGSNYNPYVGTFGALLAKYQAVPKSYMRNLDDIANNGVDTQGINTFTRLIDYDTANSRNNTIGLNKVPQIPTGTANPVIGTKTNWSSLTVSEKLAVVMQVITNMGKVSKGNMVANVLRVDLNTYLEWQGDIRTNSDTNVLTWLTKNRSVQAVIPVAAWNDAYPTEVTMMAEFHSPQVYFFNPAQPLTATNVEVRTRQILNGYNHRTSGITILNALGLTQFQFPRV